MLADTYWKQMLTVSFPQREGYTRWCYPMQSAANSKKQHTIGYAAAGTDYTGYGDNQYTFASLGMLKCMSAFCNDAVYASAPFNTSLFGRSLMIKQLSCKTTLRNPGNNPIDISWAEIKPTSVGSAASNATPYDWAAGIIADNTAVNDDLTNVRASMTIDDLDFFPFTYPGYKQCFKTLRSGKIRLMPEQSAVIWQNIKNRKILTEGFPATAVGPHCRYLHIAFNGIMANSGAAAPQTTLATDYIGYPGSQVDIEQRLYFKGRAWPQLTVPGVTKNRISYGLYPNSATGPRYPAATAGETFTEVVSASIVPVP